MKGILIILIAIVSVNSFAQVNTNANKQFVAVLTLTKTYQDDNNWKEKEQAIVSEHFQRLVKFKDEGKVILAGRTDLQTNDPEMMGLVIFYANDEKEAKQFMADDPAVKIRLCW